MLSSCLASGPPTWQGVRVTTAPRPAASAPRTPAPAPSCSTRPERLLLEEGYAAVTSRRVAAKAGLKPQLVHYYFRTMDDLFLEVFRRRAEEGFAQFERAIADEPSLRTIWSSADPRHRLRVQPRVRCAREPPQGDPRRDGELRRTVPDDATRSGRVDPRGPRTVAGWRSRPTWCSWRSRAWPSSSRWSARSASAADTTQALAFVEQYLDNFRRNLTFTPPSPAAAEVRIFLSRDRRGRGSNHAISDGGPASRAI